MFTRRFGMSSTEPTIPSSEIVEEMYLFCMSCGISKAKNVFEQCKKCHSSMTLSRTFHPMNGKNLNVPYKYSGSLFKERLNKEFHDTNVFSPVVESKIVRSDIPPFIPTVAAEGITNEYLNLIFLLDITGSMEIFINEAIKHIESQQTRIAESMITKLAEQYGDLRKFTLFTTTSVIAYRDVCDSKQIEFCPPTLDTNAVKTFLTRIIPSGGGDSPEDILSAFDFTFSNISFPEKDSEKWMHTSNVLLLVADAPAHGLFMHPICRDDCVRQNDETLWKQYMAKLRDLNIDFVCVQLTKSMDTMIDFFKKHHNVKDLFELQVVRQVTGNIAQSRIDMEDCAIYQARYSCGRRYEIYA